MCSGGVYIFALLFFFSFAKAQDAETDSLKKLVAAAENDSAKVDAMISLGKNYFSTNPDLGIKTCNEAKQLAEKINYNKGVALALKSSGIGFYRQAKYVDALQDWEQSKKMYESIGDKKGVANMLSNSFLVLHSFGHT